MKRLTGKIVSIALAASMMMPLVTACGKKGSREVIDSDTPWYNVRTINIDVGGNPEDYDYRYTDYIGELDGQYVYRTSGSYVLPDDFNWETDDYTAYEFYEVHAFDSDGNITASVSVSDLLREEGLASKISIGSIDKIGDSLIVSFSAYEGDYEDVENYTATVDIANEAIADIKVADGGEFAQIVEDRGASDEGSVYIAGYTIRKFWLSGESNTSYLLAITAPDGSSEMIDLSQELPNQSIFNINTILDKGDNQALICGSSENSSIYIDLNLNDYSVAVAEDDYSWLDYDQYQLKTVDGFGTVKVDSQGIYVIDYANHGFEPVFLYENSNVNRYNVSNLTPVMISDERVVLAGSTYRFTYNYSADTTTSLVVFDRAESNPNVGKSVIRAASVGDYSYALCDAVCKFNDSNADYFIKFDTRYALQNYIDYSQITSDSDAGAYADSVMSELGNQLTIDLMAGEGPDIILDCSSFSQLNNPDYLIDLSDIFANDLGMDNYFGNILDIARYTDGAIYQAPLTFMLQGIATSSSNVEPGQVGFTFDQYAAFVDEVCNGTDPLGRGRMDFFINSMNGMIDLMVDENGNLNFDNDAFRALAQYTSENVLEQVSYDDEYYSSTEEAHEAYVNSISSYFEAVSGDKVIVGYPSYDARGPMVSSNASIGISAQSSNIDGCKEFVRLIFSDECQEIYGMSGGVPINRNAFETVANDYVTNHNAEVDRVLAHSTEAEIHAEGIDVSYADESDIAEFMSIVEGLRGNISASDGAVNAIIREEIPAYFEGQKSIDDVIRIIQDRVQTVISERS